jgi:8-oxo-dGTP diphosphatase
MIKVKITKKLEGATILVMNEEGNILLLRRASNSTFAPDQWGYPGGKIEEGESSVVAAMRETEEETELVVRDPEPLGVFNGAVEAFFSDTFEGEVKIDFEHTAWKWVAPRDLIAYDLAPAVLEIFEKARACGH